MEQLIFGRLLNFTVVFFIYKTDKARSTLVNWKKANNGPLC